MIKKKDVRNSRKIRVCIVSYYGYSLYNKEINISYGGSEVQLYLISKELCKEKNFAINVIVGEQNLRERVENYHNQKIHVTLPIERSFRNYVKAVFNLSKALIRINPEIIIQRSAGVETGLLALYCKLFKKKFIFSIANLTNVNGKNERGFLGKIFKYGIDNATNIVAQSKEQIIELEKYKKRKFKNITVIKSGYELTNEQPKNKKYILWVARAIDWKRPEFFLKLAEKFPNEKFLMICNKTDNKIESIKYWKTIYDKASKISNLKFLEFVPFNEINQFFEQAKIFINTSSYEGFPNTFIQALKNKTPIVSLNVDPDKFLTVNKCGFICFNNFKNMRQNIKMLLDDKELYEIYSNNAYNYIKKNHNIENIAKKWSDLINYLDREKKNALNVKSCLLKS